MCWCREGISLKQVVDFRFVRRHGNFLVDRGDEVLIEFASELVEPRPVLGDRLEHDFSSVPPYADFVGVEPVFLRQPHGLRAAGPEDFGCIHGWGSAICLYHLREGDTVVVWKLDRLSRSLKDVLHIMERIAKAGAGFRSITENIDTTTPAGRMMMQMVGAFAEFERAMMRERTSAGLASARVEGRVGGRRKKLDAAKRREIAESVVSARKSGAEMARLYGVSQPTVSRIVAAHLAGQT